MQTDLADPRIRRGMETQLARRRALIGSGERAIGWKVGFGAPEAQKRFRLTAPLVGFLLERGRVASGAPLSLAGWARPVAEPEIALHIGAHLAAGAGDAAARAAIAAIGPAFELVDLDPPPDEVEPALAGNLFQRHVVLGPADATRAGGRLDGLTARVRRNGVEAVATADLEASTGPIVAIVRHVADTLAGFGETLQAGQVIIAGSIVAPFLLGPQDQELAFELAPVGSVSVRFEHG